jgi:hypothetical protein
MIAVEFESKAAAARRDQRRGAHEDARLLIVLGGPQGEGLSRGQAASGSF